MDEICHRDLTSTDFFFLILEYLSHAAISQSSFELSDYTKKALNVTSLENKNH